MTDAHCHVSCGDPSVRELIVGRDFFGVHPWETLTAPTQLPIDSASTLTDPTQTLIDPNPPRTLASLRSKLLANPKTGVGEIGLDRLKVRDIPPLMREVFEAQLALAIELGRPVVLHGAKCWGQVVSAVKRARTSGTFLFHGFSRSDGLIPDIVALGGFISVGPAVLNDHAVNYRKLVKKIPLDRLLIETDAVVGGRVPARPHIRDVLAKTAEIIGVSAEELEKVTDENAEKFFCASP